MVLSTNYAQAGIEDLHRGVVLFGSAEQKARADELLRGHLNVGLGLEVSRRLHHDAMLQLLMEATGNVSADAAKEEQRITARRNLGLPEV